MRIRWGRWCSVAALVAAVASTAGAQEAPAMMPGPDGIHVVGSMTVGGVVFTAERLEALVEAYKADPASLPADLPAQVRDVVYRLAGGGR